MYVDDHNADTTHLQNAKVTNVSLKRDATSSQEILLKKLSDIHQLLSRSERNRKIAPNVSGTLIDQVLDEMEAIKNNSTNPQNLECNIKDHWISHSAGGVFDLTNIETKGQKRLKIPWKSAQDSVHYGFMNMKDWCTTVNFPYSNNTQYIIVTGMNRRDKIVATFMGECRRMHKKEVLQGNWFIVAHSRNCESLGTTAKLIGDVWRKHNLDKLKKKHYSLLNSKKISKSSNEHKLEVVDTNGDKVEEGTTKTNHEGKTTPLHIKLH